MDCTLVICKPDAVERGLVGEIVGRFERKGLRLLAAELRSIDAETAAHLYQEHQDKEYFDNLVAFVTRSPSLVLVVKGPENTWQVARALMGTTNASQAEAGTIRGDLGLGTTENLVHGSDSADSAVREIALFFPEV